MVVLTYIFFVSHAAWKAPLAGLGSIEAKCVLPNQGCTAPAQGTSFIDASGKAKQGIVTGLSAGTTYDCYVVADPKLLKMDKCSKPVRITTLASPTFVYKSSVTPVPIGRKLLQTLTSDTSRCFIGPTGNFTDCVNSGLDNDTVIVGGVVDPNKQFITFDRSSASDPSLNDNLTTCPINPAGIIDSDTCVTAYSPPAGYGADEYTFDALARRVWFKLIGKNGAVKKEAGGQRAPPNFNIFATCAINAQGEYTGCTQSQPVPGLSYVVGSTPDASGFYVANVTANGTLFCQNDFSCSPVAGLPTVNGTTVETESVSFLTDNVVYFVGESNNTYTTYTCNVQNPTTFTDCQKVFEEPGKGQALFAPANNGLNAYVVEIYPSDQADRRSARALRAPQFLVCDVNQSTGVFENCKPISNDPSFLDTLPIFSSPIVF
jgi:hypothetical protein